VLGAALVLAAAALAMTWQPQGRAVDPPMRPAEGPDLVPIDGAGVPDAFAWRWSGPPRAWCVRVFDAEFAELARLGPAAADGTSLPVPADLRARLREGASYHWVVEADDDGPPVRSRIGAFTVAPR